MTTTLEEYRELIDTRNNVRAAVLALEECYVCERITECEAGTIEWGACWICADCLERARRRERCPKQP